MLLSIKVNNYALIDELEVEFHRSLNIITGETGAGKSILLGALGLIMGKRADITVLRDSEGKCIVEAEFDLSGYKGLSKVFAENDIDFENHSVFRREILSTGKSRAFINDTPVNLSVMNDIALGLIDIHSQHQNLLLNQQAFILEIIDRYCRNDELLILLLDKYLKYKNLEKEYLKKLDSYNRLKEEMDFLSFQHKELSEANLKEGELEELEIELDQIENAGEIKTVLHETVEILSQEETGVVDNLLMVMNKLSKISSVFPKANEFNQRINTAAVDLKDLFSEINVLFERLEFDPERHSKIKERLTGLYTLLQKYKVQNSGDLILRFKEIGEKVSVVLDGEFELEKQKKEINGMKLELMQTATELSKRRTASFPEIQQKIEVLLHEMGMPHARLSFGTEAKEVTADGIDSITFMFSANKNHPLLDVSKVASGGELSRLMLAIKALISGTTGMPTLILDEIDAGVSGEIADKVGNIIIQMSQGTQIINITHLPQVASKGSTHFLVYKDHQHELTRTGIKKLNDAERLNEIAKMLSGEHLTDAAIENARVLLGI